MSNLNIGVYNDNVELLLEDFDWTGLEVNEEAIPRTKGKVQFAFNGQLPIQFMASSKRKFQLTQTSQVLSVRGASGSDTAFTVILDYMQEGDGFMILGSVAIFGAPTKDTPKSPVDFTQGPMTGLLALIP